MNIFLMLIQEYIGIWKLKTTYRNIHQNIPEKTHIFTIEIYSYLFIDISLISSYINIIYIYTKHDVFSPNIYIYFI